MLPIFAPSIIRDYNTEGNENVESESEIEVIPFLFKHIKYLHQLQNLYFALTGKELEVNL